MATPTSRAAYKVYYDILDRALDSANGIRIGFSSKGEAHQYRVKLHYARTLDRELNCESRDRSDPKYGISDYDNLIVRIRDDKTQWWVYISRAATPGVIEELKDGATHTHRVNETSQDVHVHNLRGELQPKPRTVDDAKVPAIQPRFIRGF